MHSISGYIAITSLILASFWQSPSIAAHSQLDLFHAIKDKDYHRVEKILRADPSAAKAVYIYHKTPLHLVAQYGATNIAKLLICYGADVNACDEKQKTPLHIATSYNNPKLVQCLLKHNARVDKRAYLGQTPLEIAVCGTWRSVELAEVLLNASTTLTEDACRRTALHIAALYGYQAAINSFLQRGIDVDARTSEGWTPLHCAVWCKDERENLETVRFLVKKGANINAQTSRSSVYHENRRQQATPLHLAISKGHYSNVRLLLQLGANTEIKDANGHTPLDAALLCTHDEPEKAALARLLVQHFVKLSENNRKTVKILLDIDPLELQKQIVVSSYQAVESRNLYLPSPLNTLILDYLCPEHVMWQQEIKVKNRHEKMAQTPIAWLFQQLYTYWERRAVSNHIQEQLQSMA